MPTYEYECNSCGNRFERSQSIKAKPHAICTSCGRSARRLISAGAGLLFRGGGFYSTDYRSSGYKKQAAAESKACSGEPKSCSGPCKT